MSELERGYVPDEYKNIPEGEKTEEDVEQQLNQEAEVLETNVQEVASALETADQLPEEQKKSLVSKGERVLGAIITALGISGEVAVAYEIAQRNLDTPDKALTALAIGLGGLAAIKVGTRIFEGVDGLKRKFAA